MGNERLTGAVIIDDDGQVIDGDRSRAALLDDDTVDRMIAEADAEEEDDSDD
jgi:hypothetical protein